MSKNLYFQDLSFIKEDAPDVVQDLILSYLSSPEDHPKAQLLIPSKITHLKAQELLSRIGRFELRDRIVMTLTRTNAETYLWKYVYDKVIRQATPEELNGLSKEAFKFNTLKKIEYNSTAVLSNILKKTSDILSHPLTKFCIGIAGAIIAWKVTVLAIAFFQVTVLPIIAIKIINYVLLHLIKFGNLLYAGCQLLIKWKWRVLLFDIIIFSCTINNQNPLLPPLRAISNTAVRIAFLPFTIALIPLTFSIRAYLDFSRISNVTSRLIANQTDKIEASRIAKGISLGRTLWIQQMTKTPVSE